MKRLLLIAFLIPVLAHGQILRLDLIADTTTPPPAVSFPGGFANFTWTFGTNSAVQSGSISGSHLLGPVTFTAPSFLDVSADGSTWGTTAIYTPSAGSFSGTLYARGKTSATIGNYSDNITGTSTGLTPNKLIPVTGTVASGARGIDTVLSGSVAAASNMPINLAPYTANYRIMIIQFFDIVPSTNNTSLNALVSADGTTYDNSSGNYTWFWSDYNGTNPSSTSASLAQLISGMPNTNYRIAGAMTIYNPNGATIQPNIQGKMFGVGSAFSGNFSGNVLVNFDFTRLNAQAIKGVELLPGAGTITGKYLVIGIK